MKNFQKRLLAIFCMVAISVCLAVAKTSTAKHIVDRGETLSSIAKRYATTEAKIIELNPDAAQFVYVGMELTIPVSAVDEKTSVSVTANESTESSSKAATSEYTYEYNSMWWPVASMSIGFIAKDCNNVIVSFGVNYKVTDLFYLGARIGYIGVTSVIGKDSERKEDNTHGLIIPLEASVRLNLLPENKVALIPYAGIDPCYTIKSTTEYGVGKNKTKEKNELKKFSDRTEVGGRVGFRLSFGKDRIFGIGGAYVFSFDENGGHNWEAGMCFGF